MECTKVNCPMQAGTPTNNCSENCPWRTTVKTGDLISRAAVIDAILNDERIERNYGDVSPEGVIKVIESLPAVDAVPVVHGHWIDENPDDFLDPRMRCSICTEAESPLIKWHYCPNCGAKMDGKDSE